MIELLMAGGVGFTLGALMVMLLDKLTANRVAKLIQQEYEEEQLVLNGEALPYQVIDDHGDRMLNTDDLQLAKDFRREARDNDIPARLIVYGVDRG